LLRCPPPFGAALLSDEPGYRGGLSGCKPLKATKPIFFDFSRFTNVENSTQAPVFQGLSSAFSILGPKSLFSRREAFSCRFGHLGHDEFVMAGPSEAHLTPLSPHFFPIRRYPVL
jgi:hypothetical protein